MNEFGDFSRSTSMESDDDKSNKNQVDAGFLFNIGSLHKAQSSVNNNLNRNQMPNDCITIASKRDDFYYNMQQSINGRCIILNFESFDAPDLSKRRGTEMDVRRLSKTFQKLNFVVEIHNDLTQQKTFEIFRQESQRDHSSYNCFTICILTHGSNGILHTKDKKFDTSKMFDFFTGNRCKSLIGKPKMFFIQACQGEMFDSGVLVHDSPIDQPSYFMVPNYADFLIFYSTFPGFYSWRNVENGSWFIQTLCDVLDQYSNKFDMMTLLTIVSQKVAINYESRVPNDLTMHKKKQIPCVMSTLTRLITFLN